MVVESCTKVGTLKPMLVVPRTGDIRLQNMVLPSHVNLSEWGPTLPTVVMESTIVVTNCMQHSYFLQITFVPTTALVRDWRCRTGHPDKWVEFLA